MMKSATNTPPQRFDRRPGSAGQIYGQGLQHHHERAVCESLRQPVRCRVRQLLGFFQDPGDERTASGRHHLVPPRRGARLQPQAGEHAVGEQLPEPDPHRQQRIARVRRGGLAEDPPYAGLQFVQTGQKQACLLPNIRNTYGCDTPI